MLTYVVLDEKRYELSDKIVFFEEGESIIIMIDGQRVGKKVFSIRKILKPTGNNMDCDIEVHIG